MIRVNEQGFEFDKTSYWKGGRQIERFHHIKNKEYRLKLVYIQRAHVMDFEILRGIAKKIPLSVTHYKFWKWDTKDESKCQKARDEIDKLCEKYSIT